MTDDTTDAPLTVERRGAVLQIILNRPAVRNAANRSMAVAMGEALDLLESDDELRVGVISGAGDHFCAGMDLRAFVSGETPMVDGGFMAITERTITKPLIAAVEGYALAGGFEVALSCDVIVASDTARFGIPESRRGLVAAAGGLVRLPDRVPETIALYLALTGDQIDATRAYDLGLAAVASPAGKALEAALTVADTIAANGPMAVRVSKELITKSRDWPRQDRFVKQRPYADAVFASQDAMEGASAFAEKRSPVWTGR